MPKKRDVVIGVVIAVVFLFAFGFVALAFIGIMSDDDAFSLSSFGGNIGVLKVFGVINEEMGRPIIEQLDKWADNSSIKAIVIHINSPGGGVAISQEIYDAIKRARTEKPIVASMASVAASGGYYIACAADRTIANPGTITGSIGVIFQFHTYKDLMSKIGIGTETVKSGLLKDVGSYSRDMTKQESLMLQAVVMDTYEQFVNAVAEGRGMEKDEIYPLADGSIFTGVQALNLGLIDSLGGLNEAIEIAADLAMLEGEPKIVKPRARKRLSAFDLLGGLLGELKEVVKPEVQGPQLLYLFN